MKRIIIALSVGIISAALITPQEAHAGRFGFHFSPVFIPKPQYYGHGYQRRNWDYEDKYEARARRYREQGFTKIKRRRAAIAAKKRQEIARRRAAAELAAERRLSSRGSRQRSRLANRRVFDMRASTSKPTAPSSPTLSTSPTDTPLPTEVLLTSQESGKKIAPPTTNHDRPKSAAPSKPAEPTCKKFLPSAGLTISVPCAQ